MQMFLIKCVFDFKKVFRHIANLTAAIEFKQTCWDNGAYPKYCQVNILKESSRLVKRIINIYYIIIIEHKLRKLSLN